jgi:hypothetical protein
MRVEELTADLLAVEREEVALIAHMRSVGTKIAWRPDTDPRALLQIDGDIPPPSEQ